MKLIELIVCNFRQFYGEHRVRFSTDKERNVTVLRGSNGFGKTGLFTSIIWCLYGDDQVDGDVGELFNKLAQQEADEAGTSAEGWVQVRFQHDHKEYRARRSLCLRQDLLGKSTKDGDFVVALLRPKRKPQIIRNPSVFVESVLPPSVRRYFFFDGEKLDELVKTDSSDVRDAINGMVQMPALHRAQQHLSALVKDWGSEISKGPDEDLGELTRSQMSLEDKIVDLNERRRTLTQEKTRNEKERIALENKLLKESEARGLAERRRALEERTDGQEQARSQCVEALCKAAVGAYPCLIADYLTEAEHLVSANRAKALLPPDLHAILLKDILKTGRCICGRSVREHDEAAAFIMSVLDGEMPADGISSTLWGLESKLSRLLMDVPKHLDKVDTLRQSRDDCDAELDLLYGRLDQVERELSRTDQVGIQEILDAKTKVDDLRVGILRDLEVVGDSLIEARSELADLNNQLSKVSSSQCEIECLRSQKSLAGKAVRVLEELIEAFIDQVRQEAQGQTRAIFDRLAVKQEQFDDVMIDTSFDIQVLDRWGKLCRAELSAGERQVLGLSFICGMSAVAGIDVPLIMDTPFGRLSGEALEKVAGGLPSLTHQLILFVTDREWDGEAKAGIGDRLGAFYKLDFDDAAGTTSLRGGL